MMSLARSSRPRSVAPSREVELDAASTTRVPRIRINRAIEAAARGGFGDAIRLLEEEALACGGAENLPARALTTYAVALVETNRKRIQVAVELCRHALSREFVDPDLFADLGHVYVVAGMRRRALEAVNRGLAIDPQHARLITLRKEMGLRRRPVLGFLERGHPLNVFLGRLLHA